MPKKSNTAVQLITHWINKQTVQRIVAFVWLLLSLFATKHNDNLLRGFLLKVSELVRFKNIFLQWCIGMGRLIAVHGIRGFKAHGSVHRRQFAYRGFSRF